MRVYLLYDDLGSVEPPEVSLDQVRMAGGYVASFRTALGLGKRFQINFRNHRKIVVVDGTKAFVGGHNVGDQYLGRNDYFGRWRDTHIWIEGPAVPCIQLSFLEDWHWATQETLELRWSPRAVAIPGQKVLVLPWGPADELNTGSLFFVHVIHQARERLWIASPYFVPDDQVVAALELAVIRGVDVRILVPQKPDHLLVYLSGFTYIEEMAPSGVKFYRYQPGFLHQKVMLVDDDVAAVGTANLDYRSLYINFEMTLLSVDRTFATEVAEMLEQDFRDARQIGVEEFEARPIWFRVAARVARLLAPLQ
ncbi:cardiolipin synthase [Sulfidibacter corallicola]